MYLIEVTLDGNPVPLQLCRCLTVESVAAIVTALFTSSETRPITIRRDPNWIEPPQTPARDWPEGQL